jgi:hypothetical protein
MSPASPGPDMPDPTLSAFFNGLADDELIARVQGGLTDEARPIAWAELASRGLARPPESLAVASEPSPYLGDRVLLERNLSPTEAHLLSACLRAAGIQADAGDTNIVQAHGLLALAVGGAKVRVPQSQWQDARLVLQAFRRGEFTLSDDFDVGDAAS